MEFSYHRRAGGLRALATVLAATVAVDVAVVVVVAVLLPRPWNIGVALLGLSMLTYSIYSLTLLVRARHRVLEDRLLLTFGSFRLEVPRGSISEANLISSIPAAAAARTWPVHRPAEDTLYLTPHREGLVELKLAAPLTARLVRSAPPAEFSRIVLSLDEPEAFLEAIGRGGDGGTNGPFGGNDSGKGRPDGPPRESAPGDARPAGEGSTGDLPPRHSTNGLAFSAPPRSAAGPALTSLVSPAPGSIDAAGSAETTGAAIILENLTKRYGDFTAVSDVSLTVRRGEILAFLGSNGAGKSTTIRMMTGVLRPTAGRVLVHGLDVWKDGPAARRLIGYVPDTPLLYESLTAQEFLWFVGGLYELEPEEARARAAELLEMLQMSEWRDQLIRSFSLGMRRKMSIAAALMHRPQVLLLDEVTNGLDPRSARVVKDLILAEAERGASVFLTTHILEVAGELAHRFAFIDRGRVLALGTKEEVESRLGLAGATLEELFLTATQEPAMRSGVN